MADDLLAWESARPYRIRSWRTDFMSTACCSVGGASRSMDPRCGVRMDGLLPRGEGGPGEGCGGQLGGRPPTPDVVEMLLRLESGACLHHRLHVRG